MMSNEFRMYDSYESDWKEAESRDPDFNMDDHVASAWAWWKSLGSPKNIVAPMVDASEVSPYES